MFEQFAEDDMIYIDIEFEDGCIMNAAVILAYTVNGKDYVAVGEVDENGEFTESEDAYIFRATEGEGTLEVDDIESDIEYKLAAMAFESIMKEQEEKHGRRDSSPDPFPCGRDAGMDDEDEIIAFAMESARRKGKFYE